MLIKSSLSPSLVSYPPNSLELFISSIKLRHRSFYIGTFYRPPSSNSDIQPFLSNLSSSTLSNLILVGDFNVHYTHDSSSPLFLQLKTFANSYSLYQAFADPTHFSHSGSPSIINLAYIPSTFPSKYHILPLSPPPIITPFSSTSPHLFPHHLSLPTPPATISDFMNKAGISKIN